MNRDHWGQVAILETKSKTSISWFLSLRPSPRLEFSEFQFQDRVWEWKFLSLNFETKSENKDFSALISAFLWVIAILKLKEYPVTIHTNFKTKEKDKFAHRSKAMKSFAYKYKVNKKLNERY